MAQRSKTRVCGRSLAEVGGSNSTRGMDVCVVSKGKMLDNLDKEPSMDEVQSTREYKQNPAGDHRCLSLVSVVCCQVEFSATSRSLV